MKRFIHIATMVAALVCLASCDKAFDKTCLAPESGFTAPTLVQMSNVIVDANNNKAESVVFNWTKANFGAPVQVQYKVNLSLGDNTVLLGQTYSNSLSVVKGDLNARVIELGVPKNEKGTVTAQVEASVYQGDNIVPGRVIRSNSISFDVTTFNAPKDFIVIPGFYNSWGDSNDKEQWRVWEMDGGTKIYRTLVKLVEDATNTPGYCPFKLYSNGSWLGYNDGYEPAWGRIYENSDGNWAAPADEPINFITVDMNAKKGTREKVTKVGLIGSFAESGGWDHDVEFDFNTTDNVWQTPVVTLTASDEFLVRLNGSWDAEFKYGNGTTASTDVTGGFELDQSGDAANIKSPGDGSYIVKLYTNRTPFVIVYEKQ